MFYCAAGSAGKALAPTKGELVDSAALKYLRPVQVSQLFEVETLSGELNNSIALTLTVESAVVRQLLGKGVAGQEAQTETSVFLNGDSHRVVFIEAIVRTYFIDVLKLREGSQSLRN